MHDPFDQHGFRARFDWGPNGLRRLAPAAAVVVIVDVLRFTTSVSVVIERGAVVLPYRWNDGREAAYATAHDAVVAGLSPLELGDTAAGARLLIPSPNGSALAFAAREHGSAVVLAGCLRNAAPVGRVARSLAGDEGIVAVIAAGERWGSSGTRSRRTEIGPLRPAVEDLLGAGAVLAASGWAADASPEAVAAMAAFTGCGDVKSALLDSASGRELVARGHDADVGIAAEVDASGAVPVLQGDAFAPHAAFEARGRRRRRGRTL